MRPILLLFFHLIMLTGNTKMAKTPYMPTGFYFVTDGTTGVKMHLQYSKEDYTIAPEAFAKVENIVSVTLKKEPSERGNYTDLCLRFDAKGTNDLRDGTGNPLHPKMAVIIANKLLYVVDNTAKIKTGVMSILLQAYSEKELADMKSAIEHKH